MFIAIAYRYGNISGYHFPIGIFKTLDLAKSAAKSHWEFRGGKYRHRVFEISEIGKIYDAEEAKCVWHNLDA